MTEQNASRMTFAGMVRLGDLQNGDLGDGDLESAGREGRTSPNELIGREGYTPAFLGDWSIPLPLATGDRGSDMRMLRRGGRGVELKYQHFSVVMSAARRLPMITAVNIQGGAARKVQRLSTWSFDGRLDDDDQFGDALYDGNDIDRGHMVRREDPVWGSVSDAVLANADTFHFTNCCPQMAKVNQRVWLGLEDYVLKHARADQMRVTVFTGPFFDGNDLRYRGALIPRAFWKVVGIVTEDGRRSATAYKVSQECQLDELEFVFGEYKTYQTSIASVMAATGIDFSGLCDFDGFSELESTGMPASLELRSLADIRI